MWTAPELIATRLEFAFAEVFGVDVRKVSVDLPRSTVTVEVPRRSLYISALVPAQWHRFTVKVVGR